MGGTIPSLRFFRNCRRLAPIVPPHESDNHRWFSAEVQPHEAALRGYLRGAVNVISKSAFEIARPPFNYHVFESANGMYLSLGEKFGPGKGTTGWRIRPGLDFSYIVPVSKTFGFTFNGTYFSRFQQSYSSQPTWSPTGTNNVAGTAAAPALLSYRLPSAPAILSRESFSLNATLNLRDNLIARFTYARTLGRPNFIQIIPGTTVSDPAAATRTMTVNNTGLTPWTANNWDVTLEYYLNRGGLISVGAFRKDVADFFGSVTTAATPALLEQYGLSDDYVGYDLTTQFNAGDARVSGVEYAWRQRLDFLPAWARGVGVFFNGTEMQLTGSTTADFSGFTDRTVNWGVSFDQPRFSTKLNWNYTGCRRLTAVTGANVPAGTYQYLKSRRQIDVNVEFRLSRRIAAYATVRNLTNMSNVTENYAPGTPAYARTKQIDLFGAAYTLGVKGSF